MKGKERVSVVRTEVESGRTGDSVKMGLRSGVEEEEDFIEVSDKVRVRSDSQGAVPFSPVERKGREISGRNLR